jgi:hypothetical protein
VETSSAFLPSAARDRPTGFDRATEVSGRRRSQTITTNGLSIPTADHPVKIRSRPRSRDRQTAWTVPYQDPYNSGSPLARRLRLGLAYSERIAGIEQIPARYRRKILVRIDGAGATHKFREHLHLMNSAFRTVRFTVEWTINRRRRDRDRRTARRRLDP